MGEPACFAAVAVTSVIKCRLGTGAAAQLFGQRRSNLLLWLCYQCLEGKAVPLPIAALSVVGNPHRLDAAAPRPAHAGLPQPQYPTRVSVKCLVGVVAGPSWGHVLTENLTVQVLRGSTVSTRCKAGVLADTYQLGNTGVAGCSVQWRAACFNYAAPAGLWLPRLPSRATGGAKPVYPSVTCVRGAKNAGAARASFPGRRLPCLQRSAAHGLSVAAEGTCSRWTNI